MPLPLADSALSGVSMQPVVLDSEGNIEREVFYEIKSS